VSRARTVVAAVLGISIYPWDGVCDMSIDNVRPEENVIVAFTRAVAGALAAGLPMAVASIWICS